MNQSFRRLPLCLFIVSSAALGLWADPPKEGEPVLGGPKVQELQSPGTGRTFDGKPAGQRYATPDLPLQRYVQIVRESLGDSAPAAIRLTADQNQKIRDAERTFRETQRKFLGENAGEAEKLRKEAGQKRAAAKGEDAGKDADRMDPQMEPSPSGPKTDARADAAERAKKLRQAAPRPAEVQAKIWSFLTPEQQAAVKPKLDAATESMARERATKEAERRVERQIKEREAKEAKGEEAPAKNKRARAIEKFEQGSPETQAEMKAKFLERYKQLPPEQQDRVRAKLKEKGIDPDKLKDDDKK